MPVIWPARRRIILKIVVKILRVILFLVRRTILIKTRLLMNLRFPRVRFNRQIRVILLIFR